MRDTTTRGRVNVEINDPRGGYSVGGYREWPVPARLAALVDAVWSFDAGSRPTAAHRVVPETGVSICVVSSPVCGARDGPSTLALMGPIGSARFFRPEPGMRHVGVRLKPEWCRDLLGLEPADHLDRWADVEPVWGRALAGLAAHVADGRPPDRQALLKAVGRLWEGRSTSPEARLAHDALDAIRRQPHRPLEGPRRSEMLGVSTRHLRRVVKETAGTGLKRFQRIRRLHRALSATSGSHAPEWSRVALHAGYFDQAHLIREYRSLTGLTPGALRRERLALRRA